MVPSTFNWQNSFKTGAVDSGPPAGVTGTRKLDERHQRALTRYYLAAGAGGVAVGVHTTQFQIRDPKIGLYKPVLALAAESSFKAMLIASPVFAGKRRRPYGKPRSPGISPLSRGTRKSRVL